MAIPGTLDPKGDPTYDEESVRRLVREGTEHYRAGRLRPAAESYGEALASDPNSAVAFYNRSLVRVTLGDHDGADADRRAAFRIDPSLTAAWAPLAEGAACGFLSLGSIAFEEGKLDEARRAYEEAYRLAPGLSGVHVGLGIVLAEASDLAGALAAFDEALRLDAQNVEALDNRAQVLDDLGRYVEAAADRGRAAELP